MSIAMLVPVGLLGLLSFEQSKRQIEMITSEFLRDNLVLNAMQVRRILIGVEEESRKIAMSEEIRNYLESYYYDDREERIPFSALEMRLLSSLNYAHRIGVLPKGTKSYEQYYNQIQDVEGIGVWTHKWGLIYPIQYSYTLL